MLQIKSERLAYWYFRLNGCATFENFIVHPEEGHDQRTDIDILAIRFPHRAERLDDRPMKDDHFLFPKNDQCIRIILAEVKTGVCELNDTWTKAEYTNMERVVKAIGPFQDDLTEVVAAEIYRTGFYEDTKFHMSFLCIGRERSPAIYRKYPQVEQLLWCHVLDFIYTRFNRYRGEKSSNKQWPPGGRQLYRTATSSEDKEEFARGITILEG